MPNPPSRTSACTDPGRSTGSRGAAWPPAARARRPLRRDLPAAESTLGQLGRVAVRKSPARMRTSSRAVRTLGMERADLLRADPATVSGSPAVIRDARNVGSKIASRNAMGDLGRVGLRLLDLGQPQLDVPVDVGVLQRRAR